MNSSIQITVNNNNIDSEYNYGLLTFTSGNNNGLSIEVRSVESGPKITFFIPPPKQMQVGDNFSIVKGCNKTLARCKQLGNQVNFRGFPHLPGNDKILVRGGL